MTLPRSLAPSFPYRATAAGLEPGTKVEFGSLASLEFANMDNCHS